MQKTRRITDPTLISLMVAATQTKAFRKQCKEKGILEKVKKKIKENEVEFWYVSGKILEYLQLSKELIITLDPQTHIWVKLEESQNAVDAAFAFFENTFNFPQSETPLAVSKEKLIKLAMQKSYIFASDYFIETAFPSDWMNLSKEQMLEHIEKHKDPDCPEISNQKILKAINDFSILLVGFIVELLIENDKR